MHLPWPEPAWFYAVLFALTWPTFGPKGRPKADAAQREERLRQELRDYMDANAGEQLPTTSALYSKLRRAGLLRLLEAEKSAREEQLRQAEEQKKEVQLRQELRDYMDANAGQSPPTTSALYSKLRRADLLRLLEEERLPMEARLGQELRDYMEANAGQSPPTTSALYSKLRRADLLRLLEARRVQLAGRAASAGKEQKPMKRGSDRNCGTTWMPMQGNLRRRHRLYTASCEGQTCCDCWKKKGFLWKRGSDKNCGSYMDANAGQCPPTTSALYSKLRRADLLRLLEEERLPMEAQLGQELRDYMEANSGQPPPTTSALYSKLRRAGLLRLLEAEKSAREEQLRQAEEQKKGSGAPTGSAGLHGCQCWPTSANDVGSIQQVAKGRHASIAERHVAQRSGAGHKSAG